MSGGGGGVKYRTSVTMYYVYIIFVSFILFEN